MQPSRNDVQLLLQDAAEAEMAENERITAPAAIRANSFIGIPHYTQR
jgi:hypothetical protein